MVEFETEIRDVAFGGGGVGRLPEGKVVFIPFTIPGERVRARVVKETKGFAEAVLVEVLKPAPSRITPPCPYFGVCGGCQYQHIAYTEQVRLKEKQVRDTLQRLGGFRELPPIEAFASPVEFSYRNKISVHSSPSGEMGYYALDQRTVIDVERCLIANDRVNALLTEVRSKGERPERVALTDDLQRESSPEGGFHQVHTIMAGILLSWVRGHVTPKQPGAFVDLYCGSGFFTFGLGDLFQSAVGLDRDIESIHEATRRAQKESRSQIRFFAAPVEERVRWILDSCESVPRTVLLDPPRQGVPREVVEVLRKSAWECLIYVSCDPSTLARDLKLLWTGSGNEFRLVRGAIFDMFPQTGHIETAVIVHRP